MYIANLYWSYLLEKFQDFILFDSHINLGGKYHHYLIFTENQGHNAFPAGLPISSSWWLVLKKKGIRYSERGLQGWGAQSSIASQPEGSSLKLEGWEEEAKWRTERGLVKTEIIADEKTRRLGGGGSPVKVIEMRHLALRKYAWERTIRLSSYWACVQALGPISCTLTKIPPPHPENSLGVLYRWKCMIPLNHVEAK